MPASNPNTSATSTAASNEMERELTLVRIFNAPREVVFKAWTDPKQLATWWGPKVFTNPVCEVDARPGGAWRIVMRAPDGTEYPCGGVYREIVAPERLVFTNNATDRDGKPLLEGFTTVTFEDLAGKTKLTLQTRAVGLVPYAPKMLAGMEAGWSQSLDKLAEASPVFASSASTADREILATRVFDAPRELVFQMWIDPQHVGYWWGPKGFSLTTHEMDVRPGGVWRFIMHGPDGRDYQNEIVYLEIAPPERLVYRHVSPPFRSTITFVERSGKTELTVRMLFESAALRDKVAAEFGAVEGLDQHLDRLGDEVARKLARS
jgi:uncharacterized protein YndB with AHSA1/START domain